MQFSLCKLIPTTVRIFHCKNRQTKCTHFAFASSFTPRWNLLYDDPRLKRFSTTKQFTHTVKCTSADYLDVEGKEPANAKEAIIEGLKVYRSRRYAEALEIFSNCLELPGSGPQLFRNEPGGPSQGEKIAALYNIACCYAAMKETRSALVALAACLEVGYRDFKNLLMDPDLAEPRKDPRFVALLERYKNTEILKPEIDRKN